LGTSGTMKASVPAAPLDVIAPKWNVHPGAGGNAALAGAASISATGALIAANSAIPAKSRAIRVLILPIPPPPFL
jgi:hypothetical protein